MSSLLPANEGLTCEACRDTGWVDRSVEGGRTVVARCDPCPYLDLKRGFAPGVPVEERDARWKSYEIDDANREAVKHARFFVDAVHPGLYLHGTIGTGKTRLACVCLNECHAKRDQVLFVRVPEVLIKLQRMDGEESDAFLNRLMSVKVLAMDDVGASQGTDFARRMMQTIFDGRIDRGGRTVWTSNLNLDDLATFLQDDRLSSRISGNAKIVEMAGSDQREVRREKKEKTTRQKLTGQSARGW